MPDDEFGPPILEGRWTGFYRNPATRIDNFPLVAEIRQSGSEISGEMYDQVTDISDDFREVLEARGNEIPLFLRLQIKLVLSIYGPRTVGFKFRLPEVSDICGTIRGDRVKFTKVYRGAMRSETMVDGKVVGGREKPFHQVHYTGLYQLERGCISGRWAIKAPGILGLLLPSLGSGAFELYKKS
jgi:hypothetical protein